MPLDPHVSRTPEATDGSNLSGEAAKGASAEDAAAVDVAAVTARAIAGAGCDRDEALFLATQTPWPTLRDAAQAVREAYFGDVIDLCVIVNARSGACSEDCRFCAQSAHHRTGVEVYDLLAPEALVADAARLDGRGASTYGIVTSGPTVNEGELARITEAVERVPEATGMRPCASLGALSEDQLRRLKEAGLTRFHHNLETSEAFYSRICTTHAWRDRLETVRAAQRAGLEVCCGGLFGLGEGWADRIDLALALRDLGIRSVPVNFLHAVPGTALGEREPLTAEEALRIVALYRLMLPKATIRVCGGRPQVLGERQREMYAAGANAIMTGDYLTTSGISPERDRALITELGLRVAADAHP